jgi:AmmeMemoRadiSam system protein B
MPSVRQPAVAGRFYEGSREALEASVRDCFTHPLGPGSEPVLAPDGPGLVSALVSPHAGYMYSGPAAAHGSAALAADGIPETVIVLGPSHYALARAGAVSLADTWRTPLGDVLVDTDLGSRLVEASSLLEADEAAHEDEHSLEVQIPFLQFVYAERVPKICPICIRSHPARNIDQVVEDARLIGETVSELTVSSRVALVASTDFSHQLPHDSAQRQDRLALDAILALDPERLLRTVYENDISMCGPVPVAIALSFCLARGTCQADMLRYYTSGDIIGDRSAVVGYASVVIRSIGGGSS